MKLLRTRPKIRVRLPRVVLPGAQFRIQILLDAKDEVDVDAVTVTILGRVWAAQQAIDLVRLGATPTAPRPLPSGTTALDVHAVIPAGSPPTYRGTGLRVDWEVEVHASVPWWPDAHGRFEMVVGAAPAETPPQVTLFATREGGPREGEPYAELSLATRTMTPRGVLRGALAVYGTSSHRYSRATLTLRALESLGRGASWSGPGWTITVPLGNATDGAPVPFAIGIPDLVPSFQTAHATLSWSLGVEIATLWSRALAFDVPMYVGAPSAESAAASAEAYPPLGEERVRRIWQAVAEAQGLVLDGDALVATGGAVRMAIHRGRGPRGGAELVGTLSHPPLHLGLVVAPRSLGSRLLGSGAPSGVEAFDAGLETRGRSAEQVQLWIAPIARAIVALRLSARAIDDESVRVTLADAGTSERVLGEFVAAIRRLALTLDEQLRAIPLPAALVAHEAALSDAATVIGAELERGHGRAAGTRDGAKVEIATLFDEEGRAMGLRLDVAPETGLRIAAPIVVTKEPPEAWPADARRLVAKIAASSLALDEAHVVAIFEPPAMEIGTAVSRIVPAIDACLELARSLRAADGPFR